MGQLDGRTALVTGAGRGIGRSIAVALAGDGALVAINDLDVDAAQAVVDEITVAGGRAIPCPFSVLDHAAADRAVASVIADHGKVDVLVSNAGAAASGRSVLRTPASEVEAMFQLNAVAAVVLVQAVLPAMREQAWGRIIGISSSATTEIPASSSPYTMAKAALEALVLSVACEEARRGIRANVVAPGLVRTRLSAEVLDRVGRAPSALGAGATTAQVVEPDLVAAAVRYLVSPAAEGINGQRLQVGRGL